MKSQTLPVKRRLAPKGIFKRLRAVTAGNRKQRVASAAMADGDLDDSSSKISRALTIIFLIHIAAIGLIFVHQKFLDGRSPADTQVAKVVSPGVVGMPQRTESRLLAAGEKFYAVKAGDNYARVAILHGVDEADLRTANAQKDIITGTMLRIPAKRVAVAESAAVQVSPASPEMVDAVPVGSAPILRAKLVRPNTANTAQAAAVKTSGKTYTVQNGDSVWRIANRFKVDQNLLMKVNGISDARKMKVGMSLKIPH